MLTTLALVTMSLGQVAYHHDDVQFQRAPAGSSLYAICTGPSSRPPLPVTLDAYDDGSGSIAIALRIGDIYADFMRGSNLPGYGFDFSSALGGGHVYKGDWLEPGGSEGWWVSWDRVTNPELVEHNDCRMGFTLPPLAQAARLVGDATLDGLFDSTDLVTVFAAGQYEDGLPLNSTWAAGDWTADGEFNSGDLIAAMQTGAYEQPAAARAVPEPSAVLLLLIGLTVKCLARRTGHG